MIFRSGRVILFSWLCLICYAANGQENKSINPQIKAADSLYNRRAFKASSKLYFSCFNQDVSSKTNSNLFAAAKACAKASYADSAYHFLFTIVKRRGNTFFDQITDGPDFKKLHNDKRWDLLLSMIYKQQNNSDKVVGDELTALRKDRIVLEEIKLTIAYQYGTGSKKFVRYQDSVNKVDSINCYKWKSIVNTYGWLGYDAIGKEGVQAETYLYQKGDIAFMKRNFPRIAEAFKSRDIDSYDYAVIVDRISLYDTGRQIYGTQIKTKQSAADLFPIENKDSVNIRRHLIGLNSLP